ncbi:uncharacterized protein LOC144573903 [Carex rostrata]
MGQQLALSNRCSRSLSLSLSLSSPSLRPLCRSLCPHSATRSRLRHHRCDFSPSFHLSLSVTLSATVTSFSLSFRHPSSARTATVPLLLRHDATSHGIWNKKQLPLRLSLPPVPAAALPLSTLSWILKMKKETDTKPASKIKMKFAPKRPTQKKPTVPKIEPTNIKEEPMDTDLLQHIQTAKNNAGFGRRMPKIEEKVKASVEQIAFGATTSYTTFGASGSFTGLSSSKVDKEEKEYEFPWDDIQTIPSHFL